MDSTIGVLDLNETDILDVKIDTKYCVERNVHDAHVKYAVAKGYPSIPAAMSPLETRSEPLAVVCSGPSLKRFWKQVESFKNILSCSGATDFLVEHGITPTWHMETDPRAHKAAFVQHPKREIQYLIASNCHPEVFKALEGYDIRLWHVLGSENQRGVYDTYPRDHWVLTGGSNVGLRALVLARVLGFVDIHVFGMDCSSDEGTFHTGFHPNEPKKTRVVRFNDREYVTSDTFIEYARQFFKETLILSDARFSLHGDGLLQALVQDKLSRPEEIDKRVELVKQRGSQMIAMMQPSTISAEYAQLNNQLHCENSEYGIAGARHAPMVIKLVEATKAKSVLDYGCGKALLGKALPFPIWNYDPAVPPYTDPPRPADLVVCTSTLEHVEPEYLDRTLIDLARCTLQVAYFVIGTTPALKSFSDGRNTHLIVRSKDWWVNRLSLYFKIGKVVEQENEITIVAGRKHPPSPMRRWDVLEMLIKINDFRNGVEVGVSTGRTFTRVLSECPLVSWTGVDIFEERPGLEKEGGQSFEGWNLPGHERRLREIVQNCYPTRGKLIKGYSTEVAKQFEDGSLDLCFIDADHREETAAADIEAWRPKVRSGGILCGHDYQNPFPGVKRAVERLCPGFILYDDSVWAWNCP